METSTETKEDGDALTILPT